MAVVAFDRLRMLWGALDWQHGTNNPYGTTQSLTGGTSAVAGSGVGVRRCIITIDRSAQHAGADPAEIHLDFLNITSGAPDDTWTTSDFTTLEGYIDTLMGVFATNLWNSGYKVTQYAWYRVGTGVTAPNPAVRTLVKTTPISGSSASTQYHPPQVACSITFRTAVRKSWGRFYVPISALSILSTQSLATSMVDTLATAVQTMVNSAAGSEFYVGVTSKALSAFLNAEKVEVDDNLDVVRRRRWKTASYKKILP